MNNETMNDETMNDETMNNNFDNLSLTNNTINDNTTFDNMLSKLRTKLTFQNTLNEKKNILKIISILLDKK